MREKLDDNWKPIGEITAKILADLEQKQRDQFERECKDDAVPAKARAA